MGCTKADGWKLSGGYRRRPWNIGGTVTLICAHVDVCVCARVAGIRKSVDTRAHTHSMFVYIQMLMYIVCTNVDALVNTHADALVYAHVCAYVCTQVGQEVDARAAEDTNS